MWPSGHGFECLVTSVGLAGVRAYVRYAEIVTFAELMESKKSIRTVA